MHPYCVKCWVNFEWKQNQFLIPQQICNNIQICQTIKSTIKLNLNVQAAQNHKNMQIQKVQTDFQFTSTSYLKFCESNKILRLLVKVSD